MTHPFYSIYTHGFVRAAVCIPFVRVADPNYNGQQILELAKAASDNHAALALFPEMCISAYSNEDLFFQDALLEASSDVIARLVEESRHLTPVLLVGAPLKLQNKLFNCAVVIHKGEILGLVPKTYLPNYREFYEKRQFSAAGQIIGDEVSFLNRSVPFGNDLLFTADNIKGFSFHVEICEDIWAPIPPSTYGALAGATILANLSASNITIGKTDYRRMICASQASKCIAAYLYSAAGYGESTTDLAWDGYALIYESNEMLAESKRFCPDQQVIYADIDLEKLIQDRVRATSFNDSVGEYKSKLASMRTILFHFNIPQDNIALKRNISRFPYVPIDSAMLEKRCYEVYNIQVHSLQKRLASTGIKKIVIGISGGLDSTQALIVAAKTMDLLGLPRDNILAYTMPGFATSKTTRRNALLLMKALGVSGHEIDIRPSCMRMLRDIGHPYAKGEPVYDVTFENVQAGERTSHLFRLANFNDAIVLGTGDLSELALGWSTYGVGDHMSHYNVNASVAKTLIQHLIRWVCNSHQFDAKTAKVLQSILNTEISPELVPSESGTSDQPAQKTENLIGPYELQDFNLYYISRYGFCPSKVAFLSYHAWCDKTIGDWPDALPEDKKHQYELKDIKKWLQDFVYRFFKTSQFKRSVMPNGPKVGSGGSLSPRGDWRAPSDSEAVVWLEELKKNIP